MARQTPRANTACNYPCWTARFIIFRTLHVFIDKLLGGAEDIVQFMSLMPLNILTKDLKLLLAAVKLALLKIQQRETGANTACAFPYVSDLDYVISECRTTTKSV
jgi:hypothetical protein